MGEVGLRCGCGFSEGAEPPLLTLLLLTPPFPLRSQAQAAPVGAAAAAVGGSPVGGACPPPKWRSCSSAWPRASRNAGCWRRRYWEETGRDWGGGGGITADTPPPFLSFYPPPQVRHLEVSSASMAEDLCRKSAIIQSFVRDSRLGESGTPPPTPPPHFKPPPCSPRLPVPPPQRRRDPPVPPGGARGRARRVCGR